MKDSNYLELVGEFHSTFDFPIEKEPTLSTKETQELRVNLLQEELNELKQALEDGDIVEVADALCDIQYVLSGAIISFGIGDKFKELFEEVQRSNMSKACKNKAEAFDTITNYLKKDHDCHPIEKEDCILIKRTSDNKLLKSINYSPADLKTIIER